MDIFSQNDFVHGFLLFIYICLTVYEIQRLRRRFGKIPCVKLKSSLRKFYSRHHDLVDRISVSQMTTDMFPFLSSFMTYHRVVTRLTRRGVPLVDQELPTLPEYLSGHRQ